MWNLWNRLLAFFHPGPRPTPALARAVDPRCGDPCREMTFRARQARLRAGSF
jgi:hypothetical protein